MRRVLIAAVIGLSLTSLVFCALWLNARRSQSELMVLLQHGVSGSLQGFREYRSTGQGSCYANAVADFNVFRKVASLIRDNRMQRSAQYLDEVYGVLVASPEQAKKHIDELIEILIIFSIDTNDPTGFTQLSSLRNTIRED